MSDDLEDLIKRNLERMRQIEHEMLLDFVSIYDTLYHPRRALMYKWN